MISSSKPRNILTGEGIQISRGTNIAFEDVERIKRLVSTNRDFAEDADIELIHSELRNKNCRMYDIYRFGEDVISITYNPNMPIAAKLTANSSRESPEKIEARFYDLIIRQEI